jgi:adenine C2-methylase RlmN of 23S rRNA A2503 and tRNA A37
MDNAKEITKEITEQLDKTEFDYAIAIATAAEVEAGAACGQLSIITE